MDTRLEDKLRAAVSAGWRVLLVEVAFLTLVWLVYLGVMRTHSAAVLVLWGPEVSRTTVAGISLAAIALFKVALWLQAGLLLWAWMWASRLSKQGAMDARRRIDSARPDEAGAEPAARPTPAQETRSPLRSPS
jgi:hypothetical protein